MTNSTIRPSTAGMAARLIARARANHRVPFVGARRDDGGELAGRGGYLGEDEPAILSRPGAPWPGRGLRHAALAAVLHRAFTAPAVTAARGECYTEEARSLAVQWAAGFLPEGAGRDAETPCRDGPMRTLRFRLDRAVWEAGR